MIEWLKSLDRILRGDATRPEAIRDGRIDMPVGGLVLVIVLLAMLYGACMGSYALFKEIDPSIGTAGDRYLQILASTLKIPALFGLTLFVTFPSLYVFNALIGSRLTIISVLHLLIASLGVNLAVLASLGPIVAFFSVSTTSYSFMVLFNVMVLAVAGFLGLLFLGQTLNRMSQPLATTELKGLAPEDDSNEPSAGDEESAANDEQDATNQDDIDDPDPEMGALDPIDEHVLGRHVKLVFRLWMVVFGLVGAQMGWVLRPFLGNPAKPFSWFRPRESNFFEAILETIVNIITGG